jgi:hypothetical protein
MTEELIRESSTRSGAPPSPGDSHRYSPSTPFTKLGSTSGSVGENKHGTASS